MIFWFIVHLVSFFEYKTKDKKQKNIKINLLGYSSFDLINLINEPINYEFNIPLSIIGCPSDEKNVICDISYNTFIF